MLTCCNGLHDNTTIGCDPYITYLPNFSGIRVSCFHCHWSSDQVFYGRNRTDSAYDHFNAHHTLTAFKR